MNNQNEGCGKISPDNLMLFVYGELDDEKSISHIDSCPKCQDYIDEVRKLRGVAKLAGMRSPENEIMEISKLEKMAEEAVNANAKKLSIFGKNLKTSEKFYGVISKAAVVIFIASALIIAVLAGSSFYQEPAYLTGVGNDILLIESDMDEEIIVVFNDDYEDALTTFLEYGEEIEDMELAMVDIENDLILIDFESGEEFEFLDEDY
jgi:hypothetical protein